MISSMSSAGVSDWGAVMLRLVRASAPGVVGLVLAAVLLTSCISTGNISNRVYTINRSVGYSQNQAILLNIVRAANNEPLYFLSISKVGGSGSTDLKMGLPDITVGSGLSIADEKFVLSNTLDNSTNTNFDVGVLQSQDFYRGLLAQLNLVEANLLIHQGFSRAMVFSLLVDHIRVRSGGQVRLIRNDPSNRDFPDFQKYLALAIDYGLTIETYQERDASAGKGSPRAVATGRLCFDEALAEPQLAAAARTLKPQCDNQHDAKRGRGGSELAYYVDGRPQTIGIVIRSPYQIFQYLGGMLEKGTAARVLVAGDDANRAEPMLVVRRSGSNPGSCFASIAYEGASYCVPIEGADNTKRVFDLINQILALNTSTADLPVTTTVRIAP